MAHLADNTQRSVRVVEERRTTANASSGAQRHVVAARDIEAGEIIFSEETPAVAMTFRCAHNCCHACLRVLSATSKVRCAGCGVEEYCDEVCMAHASRLHHAHDGECAAVEAAVEAIRFGFAFDDLPQRFLIRALAQAGGWRGERMKESGHVAGNGSTDENNARQHSSCSTSVLSTLLARLVPHEPERNTEERRWLETVARNTLRLIMANNVDGGHLDLEAGEIVGVDELVKLACCINRNSHTLYSDKQSGQDDHYGDANPAGSSSSPVGVALYLMGSAFNHSCAPSAAYSNERWRLRVTSLQRIQAGEEVTISYLPPELSRRERREQLWRQYKFKCTCLRCCGSEEEDDEKE